MFTFSMSFKSSTSVFCFVFLLFINALPAQDFTGIWDINAAAGEGGEDCKGIVCQAKFVQTNTTVGGTVNSCNEPGVNGRLTGIAEGAQLLLTVILIEDGEDESVEMTGTINGDEISGMYESLFGCNGSWSGTRTDTLNDAEFIANDFPGEVEFGQTVNFSLTLENTGESTWQESFERRLQPIHDSCGVLQGAPIMVPSEQSVAPGETFQFEGVFTAPFETGKCAFQFQMLQGSNDFFGKTSNMIEVNVFDPCASLVAKGYHTEFGKSSDPLDCWESLTSITGFDTTSASVQENTLTLSPSGSSNALGFWTSPPLAVEGDDTLEIKWTIFSNAARENTPQFRFRVNEGGFRHSDIQSIESNGNGAMSPGFTSSVEYKQTYRVPSFATEIRLAFDLLSFNPGDDLSARVALGKVEIED